MVKKPKQIRMQAHVHYPNFLAAALVAGAAAAKYRYARPDLCSRYIASHATVPRKAARYARRYIITVTLGRERQQAQQFFDRGNGADCPM